MWPSATQSLYLYVALCLFRIGNTFLIQSFFDPDEYWQTLEPAYCEVFLKDNSSNSSLNLDCDGYTWEWKRRPSSFETFDLNTFSWLEQCLQGPIRSYLSVLPTHVFYTILRRYRQDSHFWVSQGPKLLAAVIAAAPADLAVWIMAHWMPSQHNKHNNHRLPWFCLFCSVASWFNGYSMVRTFSNSLETALLAISTALVAPELLGNSATAIWGNFRHCLCFLLGGCSVAMRFSSVTAWVPMGLILAHKQQSSYLGVAYLIRVCAVFGSFGIVLACAVDRYFYGFWTVPFLGSFHFNVMQGNATLYGAHPWHWYLTAGVPAITGLWIPFLLWDLWRIFEYRNSSAHGKLWTIIMVYTLAHSQASHKEFRFLLPALPLFCVLAGSQVQSFVTWWAYRRKPESAVLRLSHMVPIMSIMILPNLLALLYLGLFHQSAPISVNHKISSLVSSFSDRQQGEDQHYNLTFAIHYLTGACHSTPLHSYLHVPGGIQYATWSLDCSPDCRSDPHTLCESERFTKDPVGFTIDAYALDGTCEEADDNTSGSCKSDPYQKQPPEFLVTYADYARMLQPQIVESMGMVEVGRFAHGINGIRIGHIFQSGDGYADKRGMNSTEVYRRLTVLGEVLELSIDAMVLYADPSLILLP